MCKNLNSMTDIYSIHGACSDHYSFVIPAKFKNIFYGLVSACMSCGSCCVVGVWCAAI